MFNRTLFSDSKMLQNDKTTFCSKITGKLLIISEVNLGEIGVTPV